MQCYRKMPRVREANNAIKRRPEARERKNAARRIANNPERQLLNRKASLRRYGLTLDEYEARVAEQQGRCFLCGHMPNGTWRPTIRLTIDHDHQTGVLRKLLCNGCNRGLGYLKDDPDLIERAAEYVRSFRT